LIVLIAYASYFFSNGVHLSGEYLTDGLHSAPMLCHFRANLSSYRHRIPLVLWYHIEALRLL
jgi:hypothetical protein